MLTVEDIKKIFDNFEVEGFSLTDDIIFLNADYDIFCSLEKVKDWSIYGYFLQRVIEGINKDGIANIAILTECIEVQNGMCLFDFKYGDNSINNIDQAKEQAIKYILDKI